MYEEPVLHARTYVRVRYTSFILCLLLHVLILLISRSDQMSPKIATTQ